MKTFIKVFSISFFSLFTFIANAHPVIVSPRNLWMWKDVQRFNNKNAWATPHLVLRATDYPAWVISKDVDKNARRSSHEGNIQSHGYPGWIVQKGVQKIANTSANSPK